MFAFRIDRLIGDFEMALPNEDAQLFELAKSGNKKAFTKLTFPYYDMLKSRAEKQLSARVREQFAVEDVLQEIYGKVWHDFASCKCLESLPSWMQTITDNRVCDLARKVNTVKRGREFTRVNNATLTDGSYRDILVELAQNTETPSQIATSGEAIHAMRRALSVLSPNQHDAVVLRFYEKATVAESAEAMGTTVPAIRGLLRRAMENLRREMRRSSLWLEKK